MIINLSQFAGYSLIDSGNFQKLEQIGEFVILRPSPQAVWQPRMSESDWPKLDAKFIRLKGGDGKWTIYNDRIRKPFYIVHGGVKILVELTDFGHLGLFAEQASNWDRIRNLSRLAAAENRDFEVLNLFGYTGGASIAAAQGAAKVTHVDASKTSVAWARKNHEANVKDEDSIRWVVEDAMKYVLREVRRGRLYQGIILDPPSFGRGAKNEMWKIEEHLIPLLDQLKNLFAPDLSFILLSSHSPGYTPVAMRNLLLPLVTQYEGHFEEFEMLVSERDSSRALPSGACCWFVRN